ncbi:hypothetical protein EXIGLDRAFT_705036, partial [Exidia glandulosa HHB12029]
MPPLSKARRNRGAAGTQSLTRHRAKGLANAVASTGTARVPDTRVSMRTHQRLQKELSRAQTANKRLLRDKRSALRAKHDAITQRDARARQILRIRTGVEEARTAATAELAGVSATASAVLQSTVDSLEHVISDLASDLAAARAEIRLLTAKAKKLASERDRARSATDRTVSKAVRNAKVFDMRDPEQRTRYSEAARELMRDLV